ncbi:MAG: hypothetical protein PHQ23_07145 [Candidatus Wallbacteria bacterium]|nr:hypothetical protein [Candidatus Wallbacteria bacterium]
MKTLLCLAYLSVALLHATDYNPGDTVSFWQFDPVKGGEVFENGYYQTDFVCRLKGEHSIIFVEKELKPKSVPPAGFAEKLRDRFDWLYPTLSNYFGPPSDLDANGRFIIAVADIRDWFYYSMEVTAGMEPILGIYWYPFNQKQKNDYLTMDSVQSDIEAYGTLAHEFFHNIYDSANPEPLKVPDRGVNEALANYALYLNGTIDIDKYFQWQVSILKKDLETGKLLDPFDGSHDYFDISNPDIHHCYAAGYHFVYYIANYIYDSPADRRDFFTRLIYEKPNATSREKLLNAMLGLNIIASEAEYTKYYNEKFRYHLLQILDID